MSVPTIQSQGGLYQLDWADEMVSVRVDRIHTEKTGVFGEVLIRTNSPAMHPHIHGPVHFNMISTSSRNQLAKHLQTIMENSWTTILEQLCYKVVESHRMGTPTINIASHEMPDRLGMRLNPILQEQQATVFFGDGDSLKSYLSTYLAVLTNLGIVQNSLVPEPGNVLYLDYETDADTFWERVNMITAGLNQPLPQGLFYRHEIESVVNDITGIKDTVMEHGISLVIIDSAAPATVEPEKAEAVIPYFRALRSLNTTTLTIAHQTKNVKGEYPFGSTFWRNLPRSNFHIKADRNEDDVAVSLKHTKSNNGRRLKPFGFTFAFSEDDVTITTADPSKYPDLAKDVPLKERINALLLQGALSAKEVANELGENEKTVQNRLSEGIKLGNYIHLSGKYGIPTRNE